MPLPVAPPILLECGEQGLGFVDLPALLDQRAVAPVPGDPPDAIPAGGQETEGEGGPAATLRRDLDFGAEEGGLEAHDLRVHVQRAHGELAWLSGWDFRTERANNLEGLISQFLVGVQWWCCSS